MLAHEHLWQLGLGGVVLGAAYGWLFASLGVLVVATAGTTDTGIATALNTVTRTVGGALGAQLAVTIALLGASDGGVAREAGYVAGFAVLAVLVVGAFAATALPSLRRVGAAAGEPPVRAHT